MTPELFATLGVDDLRLYYNNTYVRCYKPQERQWYWWAWREFEKTSYSTDATLYYFDDLTHSDTKTIALKSVIPDFTIPPAGLYNFKNGVLLFTRHPTRSPSKGLTRHNATFSHLLYPARAAGIIPTKFFAAHEFSLCAANLTLLWETMSDLSFERGMEKIHRKQMLAFAPTLRIAISQGVLSANPSVWLKDRLIAEMDCRKERIIPLYEAFVPELIHFFADKGFTVIHD
jgi:hypothetical protein